jgi:defect in organelle trafficking protein DotA
MGKRIISCLFGLCGLPLSVMAQDLLKPTTQDLSIHYLSMIFGVVEGVLQGTGSQILGRMFGTFNSAILVMASVILSYIFISSTLNTAHEGEFLGRKWSSIWVPMRTVTGIALLLPKASGFSFIQVLVMWIVVQGVGAADHLWQTALDYLKQNGAVVQIEQNLASNADNTAFITSTLAPMLKSEVCMFALENSLNRQFKGSGVVLPNFSTSTIAQNSTASGPPDYINGAGASLSFPGPFAKGSGFDQYNGTCGRLNWTFKSGPDKANHAITTTAALQQLMFNLQPLAKAIANRIAPPDVKANTATLADSDLSLFPNMGLVIPATAFFGIMNPILADKGAGNQSLKEFIQKSEQLGWILAGSYYYQIAQLNEANRNLKDAGGLSSIVSVKTSYDQYLASVPFSGLDDQTVVKNIRVMGGVVDRYANREVNLAKKQGGSAPPDTGYKFPSWSEMQKPGGARNIIGGALSVVFNKVASGVDQFQKDLQKSITSGKDPIFGLAVIGNSLVKTVETIWGGIFAALVVITAVGVAAGAASGFWTVGASVNAMLGLLMIFTAFIPFFMIWATLNFILGCTLSYYLPMLPFILFILGGITWFAAVLEAVVAAPLVALGLTHPEGHDVLGKSEQAVMLLASVFLRPMLMVFGFIFGIILCFVSVDLFNRGFLIAVQFLRKYNGDFLILVYQVALMTIYTSAMLAIVSRSFSMIYEVPNKVLRWIGGPVEGGGEESVMQQISGQMKQDVTPIAQAAPGGQNVSSALSSGKQLGQSFRKESRTTAAAPSAKPNTPAEG